MARVTVASASSTLIATGLEGPNQGAVLVRVPTGGNDVYLDIDTAAASTTGFTVAAGESVSIPLNPGAKLFGRANSSDQAVHVLGSTVTVA